jgi:general secretion pathway protein A
MYTEHFKLNEPPFSLTPDPRFLYMSEQHREGLAHLVYGVQQPGGFVQLTGEIGSGKTTLCRCLVQQLPSNTDIALILNPRLTVLELLATVFDELGITHPEEHDSVKAFVDALNRHLLQSHAQKRKTVLIIDEAQNFSYDVLEQIRLLTNLETSRDKLLQIILIGQPELRSLLKCKELQQLAQRITARYHLHALSRHDTYAYIQHRLEVAGRRDPLFTDAAMRKIYGLSGGMPRLINIICDRALLGAYSLDKKMVSTAIVRRAGREAQGIAPWYKRIQPAWAAGIIALISLAGIAAFIASSHRFAASNNGANALSAAANTPSVTMQTEPINTIPATESPKPAAGPSPSFSAPNSDLAIMLANPSLVGEGSASFTNLFAYWGTKIAMNASNLGCKVASAHGFECLFQTGGWAKLRRLDLPAILDVRSPDGQRRRVTLVELGSDSARLAFHGQEHTFPLSEVEKVWDGSFILLWRPPFAFRQLYRGMKGEDVAWVRNAFDKLDGGTSASELRDHFDTTLQERVRRFQKEQSLAGDGVIGIETLVRLIRVAGEQKVPSIVQQNANGE